MVLVALEAKTAASSGNSSFVQDGKTMGKTIVGFIMFVCFALCDYLLNCTTIL
ncbi:hypothetical protein [Methanosarcina horonobensis]|uniref:hypothetical protein n=1 Tax=Methanosarcina horonobensis TaxID=418008 RepID=UPI000A561EAE|nr:hypothetical protein [Methanosarcina horonobensis]